MHFAKSRPQFTLAQTPAELEQGKETCPRIRGPVWQIRESVERGLRQVTVEVGNVWDHAIVDLGTGCDQVGQSIDVQKFCNVAQEDVVGKVEEMNHVGVGVRGVGMFKLLLLLEEQRGEARSEVVAPCDKKTTYCTLYSGSL